MKLIVHELQTSLTQNLTTNKIIQVVAVRPHIYRHNMPIGTLKVEIRTAGNVLVATSESIDISDIGAEAFFHGYVRFSVSAFLDKDTEYKFLLVGEDGYSFDESAYIGWCNGFDLGKYTPAVEPISSFHYPLDLEVWERKRIA